MTHSGINARGRRLLVLAAMLALTVPRLWQRGMFIDGITYAVVARNMAQGAGTFWAPSFSTTQYREFFEQPPLGIAIEAMAFRLMGDHVAVERLCALVAFAINAILISAIWRRLLPERYDWLPIVVWLVPSIVTWSVVNNMLENIQTVFTSASCLALLRAGAERSAARSAALAGAAGLGVVAAVLTKGPVGFFPLALPLAALILPAEQRPRRLLSLLAVPLLVVLVTSAISVSNDVSRRSLGAFIATHLVPALSGERGAGPRIQDLSRHLTLGIWLRMTVVVGVCWLLARRRNPLVTARREAAFFLVLGGAAAVPILVSPVLAGHYFLPSTALFALGFAALAVEPLSGLTSAPGSVSWRAPTWVAAGLTGTVVVVLATHGAVEVRDRALVRDLESVSRILPERDTIGACPSTSQEWGLLNYLQRFSAVSVQADGTPENGWFLSTGSCPPPPGCQAVSETTSFALFRCGDPK